MTQKMYMAKKIEEHVIYLLCVIIASHAWVVERIFDDQLLLVSYSYYRHLSTIIFVIKVINPVGFV